MLNSKEFVRELQLRHESAWMNPNLESADAALAALSLIHISEPTRRS